nr:MAG TPA: hypothetical protein [Caudoviricetes sp.]
MWYVNVLENALPAFIPIRFYINYVVCKCAISNFFFKF